MHPHPVIDPPGPPSTLEPTLFDSFWMAGFEGADHVNGLGDALNMTQSNHHVDHVDADYRLAAGMGLRTVRESIGWRLADGAANGRTLDRTLRFMDAARRNGIQIVWSLLHYGTPADVRLDGTGFAERFADFAAHVARRLASEFERVPIYNPINEISFLSWGVAETNLFDPYRNEGRSGTASDGYGIKGRMVRAALLAMQAMRAEDPRARFIHIEPVVHAAPPVDRPDLAAAAEEARGWQWQAWDMIAGRIAPELGGTPEALDLIGINHYHSSQWEAGSGRPLAWHLGDPRWLPLSDLLMEVWRRYRRPLIVAETSHVGVGRGPWLLDVARSAVRARAQGVPLQGICLYPAIDRHDWSNAQHWHESGLWDVDPADSMRRRLNFGYAKALRRSQQRMGSRK